MLIGLHYAFNVLTDDAEALKARILERFLQYLTDLQAAKVAAGGQPASAARVDVRATRTTMEHQTCLDTISGDAFDDELPTARSASIGPSAAFTSSVASCATSAGSQALTPRAVAEMEMKAYLGMKDPPTLSNYSLRATLEYWEKDGRHKFPLVAMLARALLSVRGAAAIIEVDFCLAGHMVSPKRSSLDPAFVEMTLVLNSLGLQGIPSPDQVPRLTTAQAVDAIPDRYADDAILQAAVKLDYAKGARRRQKRINVRRAIEEEEVDDILSKAFDVEFDEEEEISDSEDDYEGESDDEDTTTKRVLGKRVDDEQEEDDMEARFELMKEQSRKRREDQRRRREEEEAGL